MNRIRKSIFTITLTALLVACGTSSTGNTLPTINLTDVNSTAQSAGATLFAQTMAPTATSTVIPTDTPEPTPTSLPFKALDGLRVAYIIDGNLYVQDSGRAAIQLTSGGQVSMGGQLLFTDDGKKIVFYRVSESKKNQIYSINSDGTGERVLVTSELLSVLGLGYDEFTELISPIIVPGTHQILFSTHQLSSINPKLSDAQPKPNYDLLLVDADTGAIKRLVDIKRGGNFLVSPDGKMVVVQAPDHIDVISTQGQIVHANLLIYPADDDYLNIPMSWTEDSHELFVVPPIPVSEISGNTGFPLLRTVWRYSLDGSSGSEIRFNPPLVGEWFMISPDGNRIAYSYQLDYPASVNWNPEKPVGIYLGNQHDGTSKLLNEPQIGTSESYFIGGWLRDSTRFIIENNDMQMYLGDLQGEITPLYRGGYFSWIDNRRYFYSGDSLGEIGKEDKFRVMEYPADFVLIKSALTFVFLRP